MIPDWPLISDGRWHSVGYWIDLLPIFDSWHPNLWMSMFRYLSFVSVSMSVTLSFFTFMQHEREQLNWFSLNNIDITVYEIEIIDLLRSKIFPISESNAECQMSDLAEIFVHFRGRHRWWQRLTTICWSTRRPFRSRSTGTVGPTEHRQNGTV